MDPIAESARPPISEGPQYAEALRVTPTDGINEARSFFGSMGMPTDQSGFIARDLSSEQVERLRKYEVESTNDSIEMPTEQEFYRKVLLAASLWRQTDESGINYLFGKGVGAEIAIQGIALGRTRRNVDISYRSHSDFELYGVNTDKPVYTDEFKAVFGAQEYFPPTKTKGLRNLPPELLHQTAQAVDLGGTTLLVPELELLFLDKLEGPGVHERPEGSDAFTLARQYELDRTKIHDYLERFVIEPGTEQLEEKYQNSPRVHLKGIGTNLSLLRSELSEEGITMSNDELVAELNRRMQQRAEEYAGQPEYDTISYFGVGLRHWTDLRPEQIDADGNLVDQELIDLITTRYQTEGIIAKEALKAKHGAVDRLLEAASKPPEPQADR